MSPSFDLQGHRGARGLKPENTLPSFEAALDVGVTTLETDLHLTARRRGGPQSRSRHERASVSASAGHRRRSRPASLDKQLDPGQLRGYRADRNPDRKRFPDQDVRVTPVARLFADRQQMDPYTPPTLAELFAFAAAYAEDLGGPAGKTAAQRATGRQVQFDLELSGCPFSRS